MKHNVDGPAKPLDKGRRGLPRLCDGQAGSIIRVCRELIVIGNPHEVYAVGMGADSVSRLCRGDSLSKNMRDPGSEMF
jgi:hypothetical protein